MYIIVRFVFVVLKLIEKIVNICYNYKAIKYCFKRDCQQTINQKFYLYNTATQTNIRNPRATK